MTTTHMRSRHSRLTALAVVLAVGSLGMAACGDSEADVGSGGEAGAGSVAGDPSRPAPGQDAASAALESGRTVIDVRTPEEYEAGHVEGATLIDIQGPEFADGIGALDPDGEYVVYCRSGNRSAVAAAQMADIGLDVVDGGGLDDMESAGWPVTG